MVKWHNIYNGCYGCSKQLFLYLAIATMKMCGPCSIVAANSFGNTTYEVMMTTKANDPSVNINLSLIIDINVNLWRNSRTSPIVAFSEWLLIFLCVF